MLGKLIKYDFRSCWKRFLLVWIGLILVSAVNGFSLLYCDMANNYSFISSVFPKLLLFGMAVAALVIAFMYIYNEFRHGLLGREGYLSFTLPVKEEELIISKTLVALFMEALSAVVVVICVLLMAAISAPEYVFDRFKEVLSWLGECESLWILIAFALEFIVVLATSAIAFNLHIYTAVSAGHLSRKHHRIIGLIAFILLCVLSVHIGLRTIAGSSILYEAVVDNVLEWTWQGEVGAVMLVIAAVILVELIYSALMFFTVRYVLKNKLNLE